MIEETILKPTHFIKFAKLQKLLEDVLSKKQTCCVYIDVKNLFPVNKTKDQEVIIDEICTPDNPYPIAKTIIYYANYLMKFFRSRGIECFLIFFDDKRSSKYHDTLYPQYKRVRRLKRLSMSKKIRENFYEEFEDFYAKNAEVIKEVFSNFLHTYYVILEDLESDFIPYFCIKNIFSENGVINPHYQHIIMSADKDFFQMLLTDNVSQLVYDELENRLLLRTKENALDYFSKNSESEEKSLKSAKFFPLLLSIIGDLSDNIKAVRIPRYAIYDYFLDLLQKGVISEEDYDVDRFFLKLEEYCKGKEFIDEISRRILFLKQKIRMNYDLISFSRLEQSLQQKEREAILESFYTHSSQEKLNLLKQLCPSSYFWECLC